MSRAQGMAARDPGMALGWVQQNASLFTPAHLEELTTHLQPALDRSLARSVVADAFGQQAVGAPLPAGRPDLQPGQQPSGNTAALWEATKRQESGGRQTTPTGTPLTSPAGAIGVSQLMPETAAAEAEKMGISFDLDRLKTDSAYNESIGKHLIESAGREVRRRPDPGARGLQRWRGRCRGLDREERRSSTGADQRCRLGGEDPGRRDAGLCAGRSGAGRRGRGFGRFCLRPPGFCRCGTASRLGFRALAQQRGLSDDATDTAVSMASKQYNDKMRLFKSAQDAST